MMCNCSNLDLSGSNSLSGELRARIFGCGRHKSGIAHSVDFSESLLCRTLCATRHALCPLRHAPCMFPKLYKLTSQNTIWHIGYLFAPKHIPPIQAQDGAGHKGSIFENKENGFGYIVHGAGALQQRVTNE